MASEVPIHDVDEAGFESQVLERSKGGARGRGLLGGLVRALQAADPGAGAGHGGREGKVELAKVDVDANQRLAATFGIQGSPR